MTNPHCAKLRHQPLYTQALIDLKEQLKIIETAIFDWDNAEEAAHFLRCLEGRAQRFAAALDSTQERREEAKGNVRV